MSNSENKSNEFIPFKNKYNFEDRQKEFLRIKTAFPAKIPVIVEPSNKKQPGIDRHKYLISSDLLIGQFIYSLRSRIKLAPEEALFFFINNKLSHMSETIGEVYSREKDKDGFIYMQYSKENAFGSFK
jgi:GABA(A) receptor-associated protein